MLISLLLILLYVACVGFITWLILKHIPMPDIFKEVIPVVMAILIILWLILLLAGKAPLPSTTDFGIFGHK